MKLEIYQEKQKQEKTCRVRLIQYRDSVVLCAVDEHGNSKLCGNLFTLYSDGTGCRNLSVNENLGFKLDEKGRICEN